MNNKSKDNSKDQILEAAMKVFVRSGYAQTRMEDIAEVAGLSKGAIYHYYGSKKDLFISLIDHWEIFSFPDFYSKNNKTELASNTLKRFADVVYDAFCEKPHIFLAEIEFWALANRDRDIKDRTQKLYLKILALFEKVLLKGINSGEFKNLNPRMAAIAVMTSLQGVNWFCIFEHHEFSAREYLNEVMEFMIQGFKVKSI